jgi:hypothetical protein
MGDYSFFARHWKVSVGFRLIAFLLCSCTHRLEKIVVHLLLIYGQSISLSLVVWLESSASFFAIMKQDADNEYTTVFHKVLGSEYEICEVYKHGQNRNEVQDLSWTKQNRFRFVVVVM